MIHYIEFMKFKLKLMPLIEIEKNVIDSGASCQVLQVLRCKYVKTIIVTSRLLKNNIFLGTTDCLEIDKKKSLRKDLNMYPLLTPLLTGYS